MKIWYDDIILNPLTRFLMKLQSNPNVYPYVPFYDLSDKNIRQNIVEKKYISEEDLRKVVSRISQPNFSLSGKTEAEKILSIFEGDQIRFGPKKFIIQGKAGWIDRLNYFIRQNIPIQFTILGFPFKIPVPLKTNRVYPDMGEVLSLIRLHFIATEIQKIYSSGAIITIFTEGAFGRFTGVEDANWIAYRDFLKELIDMLCFERQLRIFDLSEMEKTIPDFSKHFQEKIRLLEEMHKQGDLKIREAYNGTLDAVLRIIAPRKNDTVLLMDVYNDHLPDDSVSETVKTIREDIRQRARASIFQYHAYLRVRDDVQYLEKVVPRAVALSVSPKPNRLGVIPVNSECVRLPYHGVPVYDPLRDVFTIEYLIDLQRSPLSYSAVYFKKDKEEKPFYYIIR